MFFDVSFFFLLLPVSFFLFSGFQVSGFWFSRFRDVEMAMGVGACVFYGFVLK